MILFETMKMAVNDKYDRAGWTPMTMSYEILLFLWTMLIFVRYDKIPMDFDRPLNRRAL